MRALIINPAFIVPLILLWVITLTAPGVFHNVLWGDEVRTWRDGIEKPLSLVLAWKHNADHAPLGHLLARAGAAMFGVEHAWALRLGNYLCGLLCVPAIWWMGRTLAGSGVGLIAAAMFAVDPNSLLQITQARMYGILMLAGICSFTLAGSILTRPENPWRRVILLGFALAAGIWAHSQIYAIVIALLILSIGLLFCDRRTAIALLGSIVIAGALGAQGVAKIVSRHDAEKLEGTEPMPAGEQLTEAIRKLGGAEWITGVLLVSTVGGAGVIYWRGRRSLAILIGLIVVVAIVNLGVAARYRPVAHARYLTIMQAPMWLAMATFLVEICRSKQAWTLGAAAAGLTIGLSIYELDRARDALVPPTRAGEFARAAQKIRESVGPDDRVALVPRMPFAMFARYYGLRVDPSIDDALAERGSPRKQRQAYADAELDRGTIWLIGVITPPMKGIHPNDDVIAVTERIAKSRGIDSSAISRVEFVKEKKRTILMQIGVSTLSVENMSHPGPDVESDD